MFRRIALVCLTLTIFWSVTGPGTFTGADFQAAVSTPQLTYKTYAGVGFHPISSAIEYTIHNSEIYATSSTGTAMPFILPLDLPQGAQIYSIDYYVVDNSETSNIESMLGTYNPQTDNWSYMASKVTSDATISIQDLNYAYSIPKQVDNTTLFYFLRIDLTDAYIQTITGARVGYTLPTPPTGAQTLTLGGYAFQPDTRSMKFAPYGDRIYLTQNASNHAMRAWLNLPIGTQITGLTYYVIDNDPSSFMTLGIMGAPVNGGLIAPYETYTGGANPNVQMYSVPVPATLSAGFSYSLYVRFDTASTNLILAGARLTYTLPTDTAVRITSSFSGINFHPDTSSIGFSSSESLLFQISADSDMGFSAPLDLPQGAHITQATCYVFDNDSSASHTIHCSLVAYEPIIAGRSEIYSAYSSSPSASSSIRQMVMIDPTHNAPVTVENGYFQYRIGVYFNVSTDASVALVGVVVETGYQTFLPTLRR